jgi:hypothetical protein
VFYGTWRFITVFTTTRIWSLSWTGLIQSTPCHRISLRSIPILSSHLRLGLLSGLFSSGFPLFDIISVQYLTFSRWWSFKFHGFWRHVVRNISDNLALSILTVMPCSVAVGGSEVFRNVGILPQHCTDSRPRRPPLLLHFYWIVYAVTKCLFRLEVFLKGTGSKHWFFFIIITCL